MKEWQRTIVLILMLGVLIGYLVWAAQTTSTNFIDTFS